VQIDNGRGRFCSKMCGIASNQHLLHAPEVKASRAAGLRLSIANGSINYPVGPANPCWKGGPSASYERFRPKLAAKMREYRKKNPEKVREWSQKRKASKTGKLPRGTVARLLELQRSTCAACRKSLKDGYHVDHIQALASGGKHIPKNIQLLCPTCNTKKGAKDPIDFMRSKGYLI
jgi:5-methylcytosine-specific restriction endonuclease McrA